MTTQSITIAATINAQVEKVWACWTGPEHITGWNFASDDWHCPSATNDVRVGGLSSSRMEAKDGSFGFDMEYVYTSVEPLKMLGYELLDGRKVLTTFEANGDTTTVTTVFEPEAENPADMQRDGWQAILNNFKAYVEGV